VKQAEEFARTGAEPLKGLTSAPKQDVDEKPIKWLDDLLQSRDARWRKCQGGRHPNRPHCKDYIEALFTEFTPWLGRPELLPMISGCHWAVWRGSMTTVVVIGNEKGNGHQIPIGTHFGMARPEGLPQACAYGAADNSASL